MKTDRFYCTPECQEWYAQHADRVSRETGSIRTSMKMKVSALPLEDRKKWAYVRLNKVMALGLVNETEYDKILHHINNGHTFMAFIKTTQEY